MRAAEAHRRLERAGWKRVRQTSNQHEIWETPEGKLRTLALNYRALDRNEEAEIRKAERAAKLRSELMTTTSLEQIEQVMPAAAPEPEVEEPWRLRVYRSGGSTPFAEMYWGEAEARILGHPTTVSVFPAVEHDVGDEENAWRLTPGGSLKVRTFNKGVVPYYAVAVKALAAVLPATGRTAVPAEELGGGFLMFMDRIKAVPTTQVNRRSRAQGLPRAARGAPLQAAPVAQEPVAAVETSNAGVTVATHTEAKAYYAKRTQNPRQAATAPTQPPAALDEPSPAGGPSAGQQTASKSKWLPPFSSTPVKRGASSLDDLREALKMLREVVAELGVTLWHDGEPVELDGIEARWML